MNGGQGKKSIYILSSRTMSSGDWHNTEESESADKIIADMQEEGILDENKEYTSEVEESKENSDNSKTESTSTKS